MKLPALLPLLILTTGLGGCMQHYYSENRDPVLKEVLGHRCVATATAQLPEATVHLLPRITLRGAAFKKAPLIEVAKGSVLRVVYIEEWSMDLDGSGNDAYAVIETGPAAGRKVIIGSAGRRPDASRAEVFLGDSPYGLTTEE